jgi:hypothetical protein
MSKHALARATRPRRLNARRGGAGTLRSPSRTPGGTGYSGRADYSNPCGGTRSTMCSDGSHRAPVPCWMLVPQPRTLRQRFYSANGVDDEHVISPDVNGEELVGGPCSSDLVLHVAGCVLHVSLPYERPEFVSSSPHLRSKLIRDTRML